MVARFRLALGLCLVLTTGACAGSILIPVEHNGIYGYIDQDLQVVLEPQYLFATEFVDGLAVVRTSDGAFHIIDRSGNSLSIIDADDANAPSDGMILFEMDGEYGYYDYQGNLELAGFSLARDFSEGKAFVRIGSQPTYVDKNGRRLFPGLSITGGGQFRDGIAPVWRRANGETSWGYIDSNGRYAIHPEYSYLGVFSEDLVEAGFGDRRGYINRQEEVVVAPTYYGAYPFEAGVALVQYQKPAFLGAYQTHWRLIDSSGVTIRTLDERIVVGSHFQDGLAVIGLAPDTLEEMSYGFLDISGNIAIEPIFDEVKGFTAGYWTVTLNSQRALVDNTGNVFYVDDIFRSRE